MGCTRRTTGPTGTLPSPTADHTHTMEWLVANVTAVGSPGREERAILGVILAGRCFGKFRPYLFSGGHFVISEPSLEL